MIPEPSADSTSTSRRRFVQTAAGFLTALLAPAAVWAHQQPNVRPRKRFHMYRWSGRGRRASRAALTHAANRRYLTIGAAFRDRPHLKAHVQLVRLDVSLREILRLFVSRRRLVVDLRHL